MDVVAASAAVVAIIVAVVAAVVAGEAVPCWKCSRFGLADGVAVLAVAHVAGIVAAVIGITQAWLSLWLW